MRSLCVLCSSLGLLTRKFVSLLSTVGMQAGNGSLDLNMAAHGTDTQHSTH